MFYLIEWRVFWGGRTGRFLLCVMLFMFCISSRAGIFYVSDSLDTTNVTSLRGAIIAANLAGGDNTIVLTNEVYALTIQGADETASFTGDLDVTNGGLAIIGLGASNVTITATNLGDRVFHVLPNVELSLLNLIITGGIPQDGESGGAVLNEGGLFLENCALAGNSSGQPTLSEGGDVAGPAGDAGAIYNVGQLTMFDCMVTENAGFKFGGNGGGVFNRGTCQLESCMFSNNYAGAGEGAPPFGGFFANGSSGGAIFNSGVITLNNCSIVRNMSGQGGNGFSFDGIVGGFGSPGTAGGNGGGIYNSGTMTITDSTISENCTGNGGDGAPDDYGGDGGDGAGIYNNGSLNLISCNVVGNNCGRGGIGGSGSLPLSLTGTPGGAGGNGGTGGGIYSAGTLSFVACTITQNSGGYGGNGSNGQAYLFPGFEQEGPGGIGGDGGTGGIVNASTNEAINMRDVLIASNMRGEGGIGGDTQTTNGDFIPVASGTNGFADVMGQFLSHGHNLIGQADGSGGFTNRINGDLVGSALSPLNAMVGPLTDNGGQTETCNLLPGSPAIDAGDDGVLGDPFDLTIDQRGEPRKSGTHVDIGAVEYDGIINGVVQPAILESGQNSGSGFRLSFNAATQLGYSVFASSDMRTWSLAGAATKISRGLFLFQDAAATNYPQRFYRVRRP